MYSYTDKKYIGVLVQGIDIKEYEYLVATIKRKGDYQYIIHKLGSQGCLDK